MYAWEQYQLIGGISTYTDIDCVLLWYHLYCGKNSGDVNHCMANLEGFALCKPVDSSTSSREVIVKIVSYLQYTPMVSSHGVVNER